MHVSRGIIHITVLNAKLDVLIWQSHRTVLIISMSMPTLVNLHNNTTKYDPSKP